MKTKDLQQNLGEISPTYDATSCILEALKGQPSDVSHSEKLLPSQIRPASEGGLTKGEPEGVSPSNEKSQRAIQVDTLPAAKRLLTRTLTQLQKGVVSPHYAKAISYVVRGFIHLTDTAEIEKRIKVLELESKQRKEHHNEQA